MVAGSLTDFCMLQEQLRIKSAWVTISVSWRFRHAHACPDLPSGIATPKLWTLRRCYAAGQVWACISVLEPPLYYCSGRSTTESDWIVNQSRFSQNH